MNKDVIYIEPEDDITDIIAKIEKAKEKIVAIVPPKKAGVFRSVVNIKLIAKSGAAAEKTIVLVTADPSIVKLAAATKLPVTKDLQTAPIIPKPEIETEEKTELIEESDGTVETKEDVEELSEPKDDDKKDDKDDEKGEDKDGDDEDEPDKEAEDKEKEKPKKSAKKTDNKFIGWIKEHKKLAIFGGIGIVVLIIGLIWALVIAPAATITVDVVTKSNNFSENVTFTTKLSEENVEEGKFYLEEKKVESASAVEFEATGTKNVGEKATGDVVVYYGFDIKSEGGSIPVNAGAVFTINGLSYKADEGVTIYWDGDITNAQKDCENYDKPSWKESGCIVSKRVKVTAAEPGSKYNISAQNSGWSTTAPVGVYSDKAMSGGTDETLKIVAQSDIDKAKNELSASNENENKEKLMETLGDDVIVINSSFSQTTAEAVSTPAVGEEVKDGVKPTLKAVTTASVFVIDKTKVEEFITAKAKLSDSEQIYEMKDPFIENFSKTDSGYVGKLKTSYITGPKLSVSSIVEMVKGKGFGDAQHILKDINGVTDVKTEGSFPWVTSVPNDSNKITVNLEIKDQNGNKVEKKESNEGKEQEQENGEQAEENKGN